ncbi:MAG: hypothetical protein CM15mV96_480 [uncultured marine virus]|nr:MAG: hypothetical protein CM15mV96_480 [uncultured marine virus]
MLMVLAKVTQLEITITLTIGALADSGSVTLSQGKI